MESDMIYICIYWELYVTWRGSISIPLFHRKRLTVTPRNNIHAQDLRSEYHPLIESYFCTSESAE